jgi:hypothetical protein
MSIYFLKKFVAVVSLGQKCVFKRFWAVANPYHPARRKVSEGTYVVKGVLKTSDWKSENVSVVVGVR